METPANRQRVELPPNPEEKLSKRYLEFREKLRSEAPLEPLPECAPHPAHEKEPLKPWPNNTNPYTGEIGGQAGPEPTRYGDWERKGRKSTSQIPNRQLAQCSTGARSDDFLHHPSNAIFQRLSGRRTVRKPLQRQLFRLFYF
ncbi:GD22004 [Drosophila simulans]|uniref:Succinate dehydrogenase assembly factor 4, mitochondrial n=1 Tax=Drosophila simulans TaxID=7240 RepID=B4Q5J6_DROSI|nr:GD22004 [Drosophila simulans]